MVRLMNGRGSVSTILFCGLLIAGGVLLCIPLGPEPEGMPYGRLMALARKRRQSAPSQ